MILHQYYDLEYFGFSPLVAVVTRCEEQEERIEEQHMRILVP